MKIIIVCRKKVTGIAPFIADQCRSLVDKGVVVEMLEITDASFRGYIRHYRELLIKIRSFQPSLIHAHYGLSGLFANFQRKIPVVVTYHGSDVNYRLLRFFSSLSIILSARNIFVSEQLRSISLKTRSRVLPCGVDSNLFIPYDQIWAKEKFEFSLTKKYILFSSSFDNKIKNAELAFKAIEILQNKIQVELVELKGKSRAEVSLLMNACDAALLTSFSEGSPQFIKEAMMCNLPCVSVKVGAVPDLFDNVDGCYLVDYYPEQIAQALEMAITRKGNILSRPKVMHLENSVIAKELVSLYKEVLHENKSKAILFYIGHPAHYHNFKNVIKSLVGMGLQVLVVVRPKDVVLDLIEDMNVPVHILPEKSGSNKLSMLLDVLKRNLLLWKLKRKHSISMMIGTDLSITQIAKFTGAKSIVVNEDDAEAVPLFSKTAYPLATHLLMPEGCSAGRFESKTIRYKGYHELAYLHPNHFSADAGVIEKAGLSQKGYIVMRFSALNAHHDSGVQGIDDAFALKIIQAIDDKYQVLITSERSLSADLEPYRMKFHPKEMHHVLAFAKAFIGDSQTMAAEAMVLGTPSIRCNDFVGRLSYLEELERHYELGFGVLPENKARILELIARLLDNQDLEATWEQRKDKMLSEKIDVVQFWKQEILKSLAED